MPLSLNKIKDRALAFARDRKDERSERAEAQTFIIGGLSFIAADQDLRKS